MCLLEYFFFLGEAARCERRSSQVWLDPTATEEALIAEDVKADICEEEGGSSWKKVRGKDAERLAGASYLIPVYRKETECVCAKETRKSEVGFQRRVRKLCRQNTATFSSAPNLQ